jgi:hypothetical protein
MAKENKERLSNPSSMKVNPEEDLTDCENPNFIYRL